MKTSSCSSRFNSRGLRFFFAGALLTLKPFGPVPDLLGEKNPWKGFHADGPLLTVARIQKVPLADPAECTGWVEALRTDSIGRPLAKTDEASWEQATAAWGPWKPEEIKGIEACTKNPCEIKLGDAEAAQLGAAPKSERKSKFMQLALGRVQRYQRTLQRKEYEFKGDPVDPWKYFDVLGFKSPLAIPADLRLEIRRNDFFPGKVKTLHQVFDTRVAVAADKSHATLWRRDAYTDHYFDGWGEWGDVQCTGSTVTVVQALVLELDLMKKGDVFSGLMRPKMRGAAEDNGTVYLQQWFERLKKAAAQQPKVAPKAAGSKSS